MQNSRSFKLDQQEQEPGTLEQENNQVNKKINIKASLRKLFLPSHL